MSIIGRMLRGTQPPAEPDPAYGALAELAADDPRWAALEALADLLLTVPDLSTAAIDALIDAAAQGSEIDAYQPAGGGGEWRIWIRPEAPHYEGRWTPKAISAFVAGEHMDSYPDECQCRTCQDNRQATAMRGVLGIPEPGQPSEPGEVA